MTSMAAAVEFLSVSVEILSGYFDPMDSHNLGTFLLIYFLKRLKLLLLKVCLIRTCCTHKQPKGSECLFNTLGTYFIFKWSWRQNKYLAWKCPILDGCNLKSLCRYQKSFEYVHWNTKIYWILFDKLKNSTTGTTLGMVLLLFTWLQEFHLTRNKLLEILSSICRTPKPFYELEVYQIKFCQISTYLHSLPLFEIFPSMIRGSYL